MKQVGLILILSAIFATVPIPAQTHLVKHYSKGMNSHMRMHRHMLNLNHAKYVCIHGTGKVKRKHCQAEVWLKRLLVPPIAHLSLWRCITYGAYPGAYHEGNGYNGLYTGWLGMTTPWLGHYPPGSDWVHSSQLAVYKIAEQEYRESGYSLTFIRHQWPQTSLACI